METFGSYVAIGDSFTEGVGDELPDGRVRGWADFVAAGLAASSDDTVLYANLAIRGRLLGPIVGTQLEPALALGPELLSINGGGNDVMRPKVSIEGVADRIAAAVDRATSTGTRVLFVSGGNPTRHLPLGAAIEKRGNQLADAVEKRFETLDVTHVNNWVDTELSDSRYWSRDKLHLNPLGHARVAANVLAALGLPAVDDPEIPHIPRQPTAAYYREYVLPWIGRRLTGRSSGDNREPKIPTLQPVERP
ncbi:SGNH/GDSL hydrolase family protein [Glaciihabitans arcticus]|uniref:SGNH/GDSL hydrolase family protein n=1 Tax=Glaciihabitans arcticus TaxID=2668039 RepID=A0A4Q9GRH6_9MICO|nr:SGNH/GDSL hydrolase family protein [Glaciihabitans arcticus]TBN57546.1 SGNH/GDSL hydrolase family protein [Glaciihabitans arcticus]